MWYTDSFIAEIPKTDLHVHLDGSLRLSTLIELAKKDNIKLPSYTEEGLKQTVFKDSYNNLGEYLHGFMYTCNVMRSAENIERISYEFAIDNQRENVFYVEPRFAPQLFMDNQTLSMEVIFDAVNKGLNRAAMEFNSKDEVKRGELPPFKYGIIACAMRMFGKSNFSPYYTTFYNMHQFSKSMDVIKLGALELAKGVIKIRDEMGIPIVSFDLAGQEAGYPAEYFKDSYDYIHRNFMHKTVHAGEAYGAESIFQAISDLHADRLGHGFYLFDETKVSDEISDKKKYINNLASFIADKRVTIEVCLTSNMQTIPDLKSLKNHALKNMLERKLSTTFCTDNRLVSSTTVSREIKLALDNFNIDADVLKNIIAYGFKRSFYPGSYAEKRVYVRQILDYYKRVATKHNIKLKD